MEKSGGTTTQLGCQGGRRGIRTGIGTRKEVVGVQVPGGDTSPLGITLEGMCMLIRERGREMEGTRE